jgi:hypothetical protein
MLKQFSRQFKAIKMALPNWQLVRSAHQVANPMRSALFVFCRSLELALGLQLGVCHSEPAPPQPSKRQAPSSSPIFSKIEFSRHYGVLVSSANPRNSVSEVKKKRNEVTLDWKVPMLFRSASPTSFAWHEVHFSSHNAESNDSGGLGYANSSQQMIKSLTL